MKRSSIGSVDVAAYLRAFALLVRHPQIALAPFVASVAEVVLYKVLPGGAGAGFLGAANSSIAGLVAQLIAFFGLSVALIVADAAWRRGRAPFDDAWDEARRKAGDIVFAAFGLGFVLYVASLIGSFLGFAGAIALGLVAYFFFIYTLPAAAIGGLPGAAALNASVERARQAPLPTAIVTAVYLFTFLYIPSLVAGAVEPIVINGSLPVADIVSTLVSAAAKAIVSGYVALVLAKTYADVSYGRFSSRW